MTRPKDVMISAWPALAHVTSETAGRPESGTKPPRQLRGQPSHGDRTLVSFGNGRFDLASRTTGVVVNVVAVVAFFELRLPATVTAHGAELTTGSTLPVTVVVHAVVALLAVRRDAVAT